MPFVGWFPLKTFKHPSQDNIDDIGSTSGVSLGRAYRFVLLIGEYSGNLLEKVLSGNSANKTGVQNTMGWSCHEPITVELFLHHLEAYRSLNEVHVELSKPK